MSHPPASYLSPVALEGALELAHLLRQAAEDVRFLVAGARAGAGGGGRAGDAARAMRDWIGPHRDTFERLMGAEAESAELTRSRLDEEADAWAAFWAEATNARRQRLHDEAMSDHRRAVQRYEQDLADYRAAIETDPSATIYLSAPHRPVAPSPPSPVPVPTAAGDYRPTG